MFYVFLSLKTATPLVPHVPGIPELAGRILAVYHDEDKVTYLDNRFRLELAAGRYAQAVHTIQQLRSLQDPRHPQSAMAYTQYAVFAAAMLATSRGKNFASSFYDSFFRAIEPLNDVDAAYVDRQFTILSDPRVRLVSDLASQPALSSIPLSSALELVREYVSSEFYYSTQAEVSKLIRHDDLKRYTVMSDVMIPTPDGRTVCAYVIRPRTQRRLPSLLEYSIYADRRIVYQDARLSAAHGYVGVNAYTPGTACSNGAVVPYLNEGLHADATIKWIGRQSWSDGRVGMFGGSYSAFPFGPPLNARRMNSRQ